MFRINLIDCLSKMTYVDILFLFQIVWVLFVNEAISTLMTDSHVPEIKLLQQKISHYARG